MDKNKNPSATPVAADGGFTAAELEFDPELLDLKKQITDIVQEYHRAYGIDERKVKQRVQEEQSRVERNDPARNKAREEEEARRREEREREREERRKERAEREFRNKEREWEGHEKDREKEKERRLMMERERVKMRQRNIEVDEQDDRYLNVTHNYFMFNNSTNQICATDNTDERLDRVRSEENVNVNWKKTSENVLPNLKNSTRDVLKKKGMCS